MRFDVDMNSSCAELFLDIRQLIMDEIGSDVYEKFSENITSYFDKNGGYCYLRTKDDYVHIGWFKGVHIKDRYGFFSGKAKIIRAHTIKILDEKNIEAIKYYIYETKLLLIENSEILKMKSNKKK